MAEYKPIAEPFKNHGLVLKVDPSQLQPGQYQDLRNLTSLQEGALSTVRGTQRKNGEFPVSGLIHTITKLRKSANQLTNFRYLGVKQSILRGAATDTGPFDPIVDLGSDAEQVRWSSVDYATGLSGNPSKYIATNASEIDTSGRSGMLKDDGTMALGTPIFWGIQPPTRPVIAVVLTSGTVNTAAAVGADGSVVTWVAGLLFPENVTGKDIVIDGVTYTVALFMDAKHLTLTTDAGTSGSPVAYTIEPDGVVANFDWLYTYRNNLTNQESNPSAVMIDRNQMADTGSFFTLHMWGTNDPQITHEEGDRTIAIYRRGGIFADGLYRLIGYVQNPGWGGLGPLAITFIDNISDDSLVNARILEFDNDAPVSSNLPIPLSATINHAAATMAGNFAVGTTGLSTITLNSLLTPSAVGDLSTLIRPGTPITVGPTHPLGPGDTTETAIVETVSSGLVLGVWLQNAHQNDEMVTADYVTNEPCKFSCLAFNSVFLAGDKNNPHVLYKSKTTRPEAFPIVNLENGASGNIVVGSPSNPIMNITEFNGEVVVMNLSTINLIRVWQGVMQAPIETPAKRGLLSSYAWCKVGNSIWYLSYDGVYSWEGGQEQKRSEAINPMFLGETVNGILPMDMRAGDGTPGDANNALQFVNFEYHNHEVNIVYRDTGGNTHRLRYSIIYDRWYIREDGPGVGENGLDVAVNAMHLDRDTGNLVLGKYISSPAGPPDRTFIEYDDLGSSESWFNQGQPNPGAAGSPIIYRAYGAAYDMGAPAAKKHYGDLVLELDNTDPTNNPDDTLQMELFWDFETPPDPSTPNPIYTYTIPTGVGRRAIPLPIFDGTLLEVGRDARAMGVRLSGSNRQPVTFYSLTLNVLPLELEQRGRAWDWDWLDYDYDKLLQVVTIEYDMGQTDGSAVSRTFCVDISSGIAGAMTRTLNVFSFVLNTVRGKANFALPHDTVCKMVRIRPLFDADQNLSFMVWKYKFQFDKWPPDIVRATSWENNDSDYDKYYQQIDFDVDTGGVGATVIFQIDGGDSQTLPLFATTSGARHINFTLTPNLKGKQARLLITPGPNGKFQLFSHKFITLPADKGPVGHSFDWDDLGHPWDKRLRTVTFEYELMRGIGGSTTVMQMDTVNGIQGSTINTAVQSFTLDGPGRAKVVFPINLDTIAKLIRIYPVSDTTVFKHWAYKFDKIDYPADIVYFTEMNDLGYPNEKILRELTLDMDTGGVQCKVGVYIDGRVQYEFFVTTTLNDKSRMITMPSRPNELIGKFFGLIFTPGLGGKAQYFKHDFNHIIEPARVFHWSSFEQDHGSNGRKLMKRIWLEWTSYDSIICSVYTDNRQLFYQKVLPAHPSRDIETFLLPARNNGVLNKSYIYTVDVDSCDTFKLYRDGCRCEIKNMNGETRTAWEQKYLYQNMPIPGV